MFASFMCDAFQEISIKKIFSSPLNWQVAPKMRSRQTIMHEEGDDEGKIQCVSSTKSFRYTMGLKAQKKCNKGPQSFISLKVDLCQDN